MENWDIFICYSGHDESNARQLYELLKPDLKVFFAKESILAGDVFATRIADALAGARVTAILVSINSEKAWYQASETAQAIDLARDSNGGKRVVPVYLAGRPKATEWNLFGLNVLHALDVTEAGMGEIARQLRALARNQPLQVASQFAPPDHILHSIPLGGMVPGYYVDDSLIDAYAERFSVARADLLIDKINAFRKQADPDAPPISKIELPRVEQVEPIRYWQSVFREARLHGPRMLAALLLVVNDYNFSEEAKASRRKLLDLLTAGAAHASA